MKTLISLALVIASISLASAQRHEGNDSHRNVVVISRPAPVVYVQRNYGYDRPVRHVEHVYVTTPYVQTYSEPYVAPCSQSYSQPSYVWVNGQYRTISTVSYGHRNDAIAYGAAGAIIGGVIGNNSGGHNGRQGALIGGIAGLIIGNSLQSQR